ncbi:MAG: hypothetical protein ACP5OO_02220 [Chloroflexia bacterium]
MREPGEVLRQVVLHVVQRCPQCRRVFSEEDVHLLGQMNETWLFSLYCPSCHVMALVGLALARPADREERVEEIAPPTPVSADEVLDMHLLLEQVNDLEELLRQMSPGEEPPR